MQFCYSYYFTLLDKVQSFMIDQVLYIRLSIFVILKNFYIRLGELFIRKLSSKLQYQFYRLLCSSPSFKIQSIRLNQTIRTTFYMSRYDSVFSNISISYLIHIKYSYWIWTFWSNLITINNVEYFSTFYNSYRLFLVQK